MWAAGRPPAPGPLTPGPQADRPASVTLLCSGRAPTPGQASPHGDSRVGHAPLQCPDRKIPSGVCWGWGVRVFWTNSPLVEKECKATLFHFSVLNVVYTVTQGDGWLIGDHEEYPPTRLSSLSAKIGRQERQKRTWSPLGSLGLRTHPQSHRQADCLLCRTGDAALAGWPGVRR